MVKWVTTNTTSMWSVRTLLTITIVIASLVRAINGFLPIQLNGSGRAIAAAASSTASGTDSRKLFGGYRITPKHCRATKTLPISDPRTTGPTICMFNHECAQRGGEVVGACMDGFLFGACCQIPNLQNIESTLINDAQNAYFQQYQQQKLQMQQIMTNPLAAQSYESYGESVQQQSMEDNMEYKKQQPLQPQESSYQTTTPQASLSSTAGSKYVSPSSSSIYTTDSATMIYKRPQESPTTVSFLSQEAEKIAADTSSQSEQEKENSDSSSTETLQGSSTTTTTTSASTTTTIAASTPSETSQPPRLHVHKDSVKISSPSSPQHSDDFVMQVLSTLPPEHESDHITFTTEVPMKIASSSSDQQSSSESNSFEELPTVTQVTMQLVERPTIKNEATKIAQQQQHLQQQQQELLQQQQQEHHQQQHLHQQQQQELLQQQQEEHDQQQHIHQQQQQHLHQQQQPQENHHQEQEQRPSNSHHHNHLILSDTEFTHSDITYTNPEAEIIEGDDLQFSTGYGPQPTYIEPPKADEESSNSYQTPTNNRPPQPEDKYVLVQTISNDEIYKKPSNGNEATTTSSITTHVDSIESIILQLNNSNHGPVYSVVNQASHSNDYPTTLSSYQDNNDSNDSNDVSYGAQKQESYVDAAKPTEIPPKTNPEDHHGQQQQKDPQVPAYLEPVTTNFNNEYTTDFMTETNNFGASSYKPVDSSSFGASINYAGDLASVLDEHTMPDKNYNDVSASGHQTSEFNKMPAMGIAYPVDMSYLDEEGSIISEEQSSGYQKITTHTTSPKPIAITTSATASGYSTYQEQSEPQVAPAYTRLPTVGDNNKKSKPSKRPVASYVGVVTSPMYTQQYPQAAVYSQVPDEVAIVSQTTKVQEGYESSANYPTPPEEQKFTTINYVETSVTTAKPQRTKPTTEGYASSISLPSVPSRPPYESLILSSSSLSSTTRPKPSKRPGTKKPNKPHGTKKPQGPQNDYQQVASAQKEPTLSKISTSTQANNAHNQELTESTNSYTLSIPQPTTTEKQPLNAYDSVASKPEKLASIQPPSNNYAQDSEEKLQVVPSYQPLVMQNQASYISSPPAKATTTTRKPSSSKKPISTSYVTGPTSPRPPVTFAYENEVPPLLIANDKLDSFIHSTAQGLAGLPTPIATEYQPPVYANSATPVQIQRPQSTYNGHKKPGFVKIKTTMKPPVPTVVITPKPSSHSNVKQPTAADSYDSAYPSTTPLTSFASTSYIYSPSITRRPDFADSTPEYISLKPISTNDFDDPGYYGNQHVSTSQQTVTRPTYAVPSDDRPAFPGYYGPTPTYPAFQIPGEKNEGTADEETFTSPNDFANFPPVRHPNLNMSAVSSAVTSDLELSTPAFVEDGVLKDKMNTLVNKIVESLHDNFEALAEMIDETTEPGTYQAAAAAATTTVTRKPTRKPSGTKPKTTTKKPATRATTKTPTKKPATTTRKPATKRTTTRKPVTTRRPTRKPTTTTTSAAPFQDEIVDEEDEEDVNPSANEVDDADTSGVGAGGRKIQCGMRPHIKSGRIVGGKGSTFGAYPWQVLVRESTWLGLFTKNKCGGVLITNKYIITAAHCQPGFLASLVAVLGEFDISGDLESKKAVTKNVKRVIVHRQYDPATFENDLALLELESPVQFDTHIVPICMPNDQADFTGRMATVTGWGRLKYGGGVPSVLQEVQVPIIENSVCQEMFHTAGHNKKILNSFLCAGYANGQKDSCEGDSGGPLVLQRPDGRYELAGTVSHGIKCAAPYLPGVYMRTTFYKPWLRSITGVK